MAGQVHTFLDGGEMGARMRDHDWSSTPLGPIESWPQSLRTAVAIVLRSPVAMVMMWGVEGVLIYNDAYAAFAGDRHPALMGVGAREAWPEIADHNDRLIHQVLGGESVSLRDQELVLDRHGTLEPAWMDLDYSPVVGEDGRPAGVLVIVVETTGRVTAEAVRRESEGRFQALVNASANVIYRMSPDWSELLSLEGRGFLADSEEGNLAWGADYLPDGEAPRVAEEIDRASRTRSMFEIEHRVRRANGTIGWTLSRAVPILDAEGDIIEWFGAASDITARKTAETAIRESDDRYRILFNSIDEGFCVIEFLDGPHGPLSDYVHVEANPAYLTHTGIPDVVGQTVREMAPDEAAGWVELYRKVLVTGEPMRFSKPLEINDRLLDVYTFRVEPPERRQVAVLFRDVTERAEAEGALRESEGRYRTLFETIDEGFCIIEMIFDGQDRPIDYRFLEVNPAFERQTGLIDAVGKRMKSLAPDHEADWFEIYGRVATTGAPIRFEHAAEALGHYYEVSAFRIGQAGQNRVAILFNDVSDRRAAERRLQALNDELEARVAQALAERRILADIVEGAEAFVQVVDTDYRFLAINKASADQFESIFGVRPKVGDSMLELLADQPEHKAAVRAIWSRALAGETFVEVGEFGDLGRERRPYEMRFSPLRDAEDRQIGAYQFVYDISERLAEQSRLREAEEALRQSQKMETIGQLTGGVAHDFNNLLTPIVGALDVLRKRLGDDERAQKLTEGALQAADRARTLVQRLLAFSRRQHLEPRPVDVGELIEGMEDLVARSIGPRIALKVEVADDLPPAQVDPNQLELALLNLAVNARDAMPEGGSLNIRTWAGPPDPQAELAAGAYVAIAVSDTGVGMDPATLSRAVEPFFTTKGVGQGTGLGLSSVHGLAVQSGGAFVLDSAPGRGVIATLWLPVADAPVSPTLDGGEFQPAPGRAATVLLVDDDPGARTAAADMLAEAGHQVRQAASAGDALALVEEGLQFDVLLTDYAMPGMTGAELARAVRTLRPGAPVLLITGYVDLADAEAGDWRRLPKPFRQHELARAVAETLGPA